MSVRGGRLNAVHAWIQWAQPFGIRGVLNSESRLSPPYPDPGTQRPSQRRIGIDRERSIYESNGFIVIKVRKAEYVSTHAQR